MKSSASSEGKLPAPSHETTAVARSYRTDTPWRRFMPNTLGQSSHTQTPARLPSPLIPPSNQLVLARQVGRYANFVGTHFWNFQDELVLLASRGGIVDAPYDHGVLHRPAAEQRRSGGGGGGGGGERTPRLVAFDTRCVCIALLCSDLLVFFCFCSGVLSFAERNLWL